MMVCGSRVRFLSDYCRLLPNAHHHFMRSSRAHSLSELLLKGARAHANTDTNQPLHHIRILRPVSIACQVQFAVTPGSEFPPTV